MILFIIGAIVIFSFTLWFFVSMPSNADTFSIDEFKAFQKALRKKTK